MPISKSLFVPGFADAAEVEFMPSVSGMPQLPDWMFYRLDNESGTGFLYGSPASDGNLEIEVIALNTHSFETQRQSLKLAIVERESQSLPPLGRLYPDFICANEQPVLLFLSSRLPHFAPPLAVTQTTSGWTN